MGSVTETVVVTAASPVVDVTSAVVAEDITLDLTEAVPTGRTYQSYLQLVPGVFPDDPESPGNPASKSGLNYSDIGGNTSVSRDNFYYIDGINVTDGVSGTFGANLNTEIIQEQQVLTGGIPAEFVGAPGLLSSVITKSGTNQFSGSVNYFFQNDGLVAENRNAADLEFSRFDAAVTGGGPIVANQAWFFGSYRRLERSDAVVALDGVDVIRTVENTQDQFYGRGTWAPTTADTLSFTFLNDPTAIGGSRDRDVTNARNRSRVQDGNNYHLKYNRVFGGVLVEGSYSRHNGEVSDFAVVPGARNSIVFRDTDVRTLEDEQLGGFGLDDLDRRDTVGYKGSAVVQVGRHAVHGGVELMRNANFRDTAYDGGLYVSLSPALSGLTAGGLIAGSFTNTQFDPTNSSTTPASSGPSTGCRTGASSTPGTTETATARSRRTSWAPASRSTARPAIRTARSIRPAGADRAGVAGDAFRRPEPVSAGHVQRQRQPVVQHRRAHGAVRALRDRRHERFRL